MDIQNKRAMYGFENHDDPRIESKYMLNAMADMGKRTNHQVLWLGTKINGDL